MTRELVITLVSHLVESNYESIELVVYGFLLGRGHIVLLGVGIGIES